LELIENLLDITRIEAGREEFNFQLVNLREIVKGVVQEIMPQAKQKGIYLLLSEPEGFLPQVKEFRPLHLTTP